ncbi:MAG: sigma-70 family RNA polymerase sigma factor [Deltaproteobacteria bacterium]|nr:sigma-70 family RNA polymerase sigma factor [Deltaproteobacteria bacterium]
MVHPLPTGDGPEVRAREYLGRGEHNRALTILMESYGDEIHRHCLAVVGNSALAADVHQTVFVQAFRDLGKFRGGSSLRTWLFAIARHRCLDALRAHRRWLKRFDSRAEMPEAPAAGGPEEVLDSQVRAHALRQALAKLKPKVRIAVVLRYQENMSFVEIGQVCGERPATVQARVARAMPVLREHLKRAGMEDSL